MDTPEHDRSDVDARFSVEHAEKNDYRPVSDLTDTRSVGHEHGGDKASEAAMPNVIDRFHEAQHFYEQILDTYHHPWNIRYSVNAFLQAFRSITFHLQAEKDKPDGLESWYRVKAEEMAGKPLLRAFLSARNTVVHQRSLEAESGAEIGLFKYYTPTLYIRRKISPFTGTEVLLDNARAFANLYEPGIAIGEQLGVARRWVIPEIGHGEIASYCRIALAYMNQIIDEMYHEFFDLCFPPHYLANPWPSRIYFETDADPELGRKWGWSPPPIGSLRRKPPDPDEAERLRLELLEFNQLMAQGGIEGAVTLQEEIDNEMEAHVVEVDDATLSAEEKL